MTREEFLNLKEGDRCKIIDASSGHLGLYHYFKMSEVVTFISFDYPFAEFTNGYIKQSLLDYEVEKIKDHE